ncbi:hypothetical protein [Paenibacillus sp. FJAT-26967]|uniref:hypothetical protein n=1 Tax=Paenibacillus sp. FJAT-26967 TaxID=1729690 RepID=UPI00083975E1|nr:hypothetical protein [Paenibacillus sp. FJAT-26967]
MTKRGSGVVFCITSLFLYILPNLLAAIATSGGKFENYTIFLNVIGEPFTGLIVLTLLLGIAFLISAEIGDYTSKKK